jgi:hypothetical protein
MQLLPQATLMYPTLRMQHTSNARAKEDEKSRPKEGAEPTPSYSTTRAGQQDSDDKIRWTKI